MEKVYAENLTIELIHGSIMRMVWTGESTAEGVRAMIAFTNACREQSEDVGRLAIIHAGDATGMRRDARRELIPYARTKPWERVAFVGVGFQIRVLIDLLSRAFRSMGMDVAEVGFVDNEAEALAWLSAPSE